MRVILHHNGRDIFEGITGRDGTLPIYGAVQGDVIEAQNPIGGSIGKAIINGCQTSVLVICTANTYIEPQPLPPDPHTATDTVDLHFHLPGGAATSAQDSAPSVAPTVLVSQDGGAQQAVSLTYDPSTQNYSGTLSYTTTRATGFEVDVKSTNPLSPTDITTSLYQMALAQYHATGPQELVQLQKSKAPSTPPTAWDIFPPDNFVGLTVDSSTLPDGTGVIAAESNLTGLAPAPNGLLTVGGPYDINGEHSINITATLSLAYQSDYYCGLQDNGAGIYRYTGSGWDLLPTTIDLSGNSAFATISQWGTYAVFAQPNTPATYSDVPSGSTFYNYIEWMACHGIASGYSDGTFRPNNNSTRGQISKMIVLAYYWDQELPAGGGHSFADVVPGSTFFAYVEAAYRMGVFSGYPCGGPGEPCDPQHRPYFHPGANVTRGQIAKILSNSANFNDQPTSQTFTDVPVGSTFYIYVERMASRGIIGGYPCGGPGEPCDSQHRPYFRPGHDATRGQLSKMIYLTVQPR